MSESPHARYSDQISIARLLAQNLWYRRGAMELLIPMICPDCNSSDLKKLSLIHADGLYESRGRIRGLFLGNTDRLFFGRYRGTSQSRLSATVGPPEKLPYATPVILWLLGFFPLMAFAGRGQLSWVMGLLSVAYFMLLPAMPIGAFVYNFFVYPKKHRRWEGTFMCQCCGALIRSLDRSAVPPGEDRHPFEDHIQVAGSPRSIEKR